MMNALKPLLVLLLTLPLLATAGCALQPRGDRPLGEIQQAYPATAAPPSAVAPAAPVLPPDVSQALLAPTAAKPAAEARFDVNASNIPARDFFLSLVEGTAYNMVVHPDVSGTISITLKNVTVPEVMDLVRSVYGYNYRRTATGYQVLSSGMMSRVFQVDYLNLIRKGMSHTQVSSGQLTQTNSDEKNRDSGSASSGSSRNETVSGSQIDTETLADFWKELQSALQLIVGTEGGRKVIVQPQAGIVMVKAMAYELDEVDAYLQAVLGNMQRQVILEAKIIEVELKDGFQSGINWSTLFAPGTGQSVVLGQTGGGTSLGTGASEIAGNSGILNPLNLVLPEGTSTSAFGGVFSAALNLNDFTAFIELLKTQGDVQVLSSPRVSTVNNQKAVIKVGTDEFFVTDVSSTTVTGTTTTTTPDITLTPFFSGIALDVTPQIDNQETVILHIHPTVSEVVDQTKEIVVGGQSQSLPLAFSTVRESDSIVRARSGQVVIIGGLMKNSEIKKDAGVPVLGDLPMVGRLFRHTQATSSKSELVILLRPWVVEKAQQWDQPLTESRERVQQFGGQMPQGW